MTYLMTYLETLGQLATAAREDTAQWQAARQGKRSPHLALLDRVTVVEVRHIDYDIFTRKRRATIYVPDEGLYHVAPERLSPLQATSAPPPEVTSGR